MNELMTIQAQTSQVKVTDIGLELTESLSVNDYIELGSKVSLLNKSAPWLLADLLGFGEEKFGDQFSQIVDSFNCKPETLRNSLYVYNKWPKHRRRPELSFAHHQTCASLDPEIADRLLDLAVEKDFSIKELRAAKKEMFSIANGDEKKEELVICCPNCDLVLDHIKIYNEVKRFLAE